MCLIKIVSHSLCPSSHNSSRVMLQHDNAIYCADQRIEHDNKTGKCARCAREDVAKPAMAKSKTPVAAALAGNEGR